ncbi:MAG TPA: hypothetical protein VHO48_10465 [Anaerolineaceae bacterium]|nr:hypothetical protein [Anaerolineaceae bacterium]
MPVIQKKVTVAAGAVSEPLAGSLYEFLPYNAKIDFGIVGSAAGFNVDVVSGSDVLAEGMEPPITNRFPINPDDFTLTDVAAAGERLKVRARNTTAGNLDLFVAVIITPI